MREMQSPSPIPFVFETIVFFIVPKSLKRFFISCFVMPTPLSLTYIFTCVFSPLSFLTMWQSIQMVPPLLVNFIAFESKFKRTYCKRLISVLITASTSSKSSNESEILIFFDEAWSIWMEIISSTACFREN